jgi:hypothetical protein
MLLYSSIVATVVTALLLLYYCIRSTTEFTTTKHTVERTSIRDRYTVLSRFVDNPSPLNMRYESQRGQNECLRENRRALFRLVLLFVSCFTVSGHNNVTTTPSQLQQPEDDSIRRPAMYTYFERIPIDRRFTDMTDEEDDEMLEFWKSSWTAAGWDPTVLGLDDARRHPSFDQYEHELDALRIDDFGKISLRRYLAMATRGGWMCDYDVFPLRDFRNQGRAEQHQLPNNGKFALYGIVTATLAVADKENWEVTLRALMDDAHQHVNKNQNQLNLWTDTMSMYSLLRNSTVHVKTNRLVLPANMLMVPSPWPENFCTKRQLRKDFLVIHFDPNSMLLGSAAIGGHPRLPRFRVAAARDIIPRYATNCGVPVISTAGD